MVSKLLKQDESAKLDFKKQLWHTSMSQEIIDFKKNELVKDIFSLTNGDKYSVNKTAYLIIGVVDGTKEISGIDESIFTPLEEFKEKLLTRLNNYAQPEFLALDINFYTVEKDKRVLVISIPPRGELICLARDLKLVTNTDKKGTTYYRVGEEIRVASPSVFKGFEEAFRNNGVILNDAEKVIESSYFISEVFEALTCNRLIVLLSQDFTDINQNQELLKVKCEEKFNDGFYHFSVPSFLNDSREYFKVLAKSCGLEDTIDKPHIWKVTMQIKLKEEPKRIMLFISDIENGNIEFDKQFAQIVRSLVAEFSNFSAIFIGKKDLASLVYGKGDLSPLNTAKELFFPDIELQVDNELIVRQFRSLVKHQNFICSYLTKETLGLYTAWSFNETINILFWKNLLVKKGKNFVWRDKLTKKIGIEIFECEQYVIKR